MKKFPALFFTALAITTLASCGNQEKYHKVKELSPYIYEVDPYTSLDEKFANDYFFERNYNWDDEPGVAGGGCSAIYKQLDDGTYAVGRNMDLNISHKAAYVVRTEIGHHKTFGLMYTFRDFSPNNDIVKKHGIPDKFYKLLPYLCDDIMNDSGLYIEINMRNGEYWPTGEDKFACSGTNPLSDKNVWMFQLPRYIAENCSRVSDVKEYIKSLNIYSQEHYWNYSFIIADKHGDQVLLEFAQNKIFWLEGENCQTNFYINSEMREIEKVLSGLGRYSYLKDHIDGVHNLDDLFNLMKDVSYYQVYTPYTCKFDPRSENIGALPYLTYELMMNDEYKELLLSLMDEFGKGVLALSRDQQRTQNKYWESVFTETIDITHGKIKVRFFEDNSNMMLITQNETIPAN